MADLRTLNVKITADTKGVDSSVKKVNKNLNTVGKSSEKASFSIAKLTKSIGGMTGAMAISAGVMGGLAVKAAVDFEQALSNISTLITEDTEKSINQLGDGIKNLLKESPKNAADLGAAAYDIVSAGITDMGRAMETLEASSKLAVAGLGSTKEATNLVTGALNAFAEQNISADEAANIFFKSVKAGKTTVAELAQSFGQVAPLAATLGVRLEELQAATSALTTANIPTSIAQTQLRSAMVALIKPTGEMEAQMEKLGLASASSAIEQYGLVGTLQLLKDSVNGDEKALAEMFGRVEGLNSVLALGGAQAEIFANILEEMDNGVNEVNNAFEKQTDTIKNTFAILRNRLTVVVLNIATNVMPLFKIAIESVITVLKILEPVLVLIGKIIAKTTPLLLAYIAGITAIKIAQTASLWIQILNSAILQQSSIIGKGIIPNIVKYIQSLSAMGIKAGTTAGAMSVLRGGLIATSSAIKTFTLSLLSNPVTAILVGITAAIVGVGVAIKKQESDFNDFKKSLEGFELVNDKALRSVLEFEQETNNSFKNLKSGITDYEQFGDNIVELTTSFTNRAIKEVNDFNRRVSSALTFFETGTDQELFASVSDALEKQVEKEKKILSDRNEAIIKLTKDLGEQVGEERLATATRLNEITKDMVEEQKAEYERLKDGVISELEELNKEGTKISLLQAEKQIKIGVKFFDDEIELYDKNLKALTELLDKQRKDGNVIAVQQTKELIRQAEEGRIGVVEQSNKMKRESIKELEELASANGRIFIDTINESVSKWEWYSSMVVEIARRIGITILQGGKYILAQVANVIASAVEAFIGALQTAGRKIQAFFSVENLKDIIAGNWDAVSSRLAETAGDNFKDSFAKSFDAVSNILEKDFADATDFGDIREKIKDDISFSRELKNAANETGKGLSNAVLDGFGDPDGGGGGGGGGGGVADEVLKEAEKLVDESIKNIKKIRDLREDVTKEQISGIDQVISKQKDIVSVLSNQESSVGDLSDKWREGYKSVSDALDDLEKDHTKKLNSINNEIEKIDDSMAKLKSSFSEDTTSNLNDFTSNAAKIIVEAEQRLKELQAQLSKESDSDRKADIQKQIAEEKAIINSKLNLSEEAQKVLNAKIDEDRKKASLNKLELLQLEFKQEEEARKENFNKELLELDERKTILQELKDEEITLNESKRDQLEEIEATITITFLENLKTREDAEIASIDRLVNKFKELASARAGVGFSVGGAVPGFASGGFTQGAKSKVAGVVHGGEYVAPAWMVNKLGGLFRNLEGMRKNGFAQGGMVGDTTNNQPITINARNVRSDVDFNSVGRQLAWMLRTN